MKYTKQRLYNPDAPINKPIWAVAYDIDNDTGYVRLSCKPTLGEIIENEKAGTHFWHNYAFVPYKKGTHIKCKSGYVSHTSRMYADTYKEAVEIYNELVQKRINKLQQMIDEAQKDLMIEYPKEDNNDIQSYREAGQKWT